MSSRRAARERVMQALYAYELGGGETAYIIKTLIKAPLAEDEVSARFAESLFIYALEHAEESDEIIAHHAENWDIARIALIDRILLRMGIAEFLCFEDIPPKVTINEAIDIAKRYSTENSGKFINGILDAAVLDLQQHARLKKSGRGLVGIQDIRSRVEPD